MPNDDGLPDVGDVITSSKFVFGQKSESGKFIKIINVSECPRYYVVLEQSDGSRKEKSFLGTVQGIDAFDGSREHAEFVVESARWADNPLTRGTTACAGRWYVSARRLNQDGTYNTDGEYIAFFMCGLLDENVLEVKDIKIIGKMKLPKPRVRKT